MNSAVTDHSVLAEPNTTRLKLRFDQGDDISSRLQKRPHLGEDLSQRDKGNVYGGQICEGGQLLWG